MGTTPTRRGAPRRHDPVRVANVYINAMANPKQRAAPIRAVAESLGTSRAYASKLVKRARQEGYLPCPERKD